jgi:hypothetical protein
VNKVLLDDLNEPFVLTSTFVLDQIANVPGPAAMTVPVGLASGKLRGIVTDKPQECFTGPYVCESGIVRKFYTLRFAPNIRIQTYDRNNHTKTSRHLVRI